MIRAVRSLLSSTLAVFLAFDSILMPLAQASLWEDRRQAMGANDLAHANTQLASLPASLSPVGPLTDDLFPTSLYSAVNATPAPAVFSKMRFKVQNPRLRELIDALPTSFGTIQDVWEGPHRGPLVLLLQDVHLNTEAQTNLAHILQRLIESQQIGAMGIEGAFERFDFSRFRAARDKALLRQVSEEFLNKNRIAAHTFVGATSEVAPPLTWGVDDPLSYEANVQAYLDAMAIKGKVSAELEKKAREFESRKDKELSFELKRIQDARSAYHTGLLGLGPYISALMDVKHSLPSLLQEEGDGFSIHLSQFLEALKMETRLDFKRVEAERDVVLSKLADVLSENDLGVLIGQSLAYKMGRLSFGDFYHHLKTTCEEKGVSLRRTPNFDSYIRYVLLADGIKAKELFSDVARLEESLLTSLIKNETERSLMAEGEWLSLAGKLLNFELTPEEWERYRALTGGHPLASGEGNNHGSLVNVGHRSRIDQRKLLPFEQFYEQADLRSHKMVEKLISEKLSHSDVQSTALITGGFHTPEVAALLKDRGVSHVIVSPRLTQMDGKPGSDYLSVFAREKTPLEKLFAGRKLFISPHAVQMVGSATFDPPPSLANINSQAAKGRSTEQDFAHALGVKPDKPRSDPGRINEKGSGGLMIPWMWRRISVSLRETLLFRSLIVPMFELWGLPGFALLLNWAGMGEVWASLAGGLLFALLHGLRAPPERAVGESRFHHWFVSVPATIFSGQSVFQFIVRSFGAFAISYLAQPGVLFTGDTSNLLGALSTVGFSAFLGFAGHALWNLPWWSQWRRFWLALRYHEPSAEQREFMDKVLTPILGVLPEDVTVVYGTDDDGNQAILINHYKDEPFSKRPIHFRYMIRFSGTDIVTPDFIELRDVNEMRMMPRPDEGWSAAMIEEAQYAIRRLFLADPLNPRFSGQINLDPYQEEAVTKTVAKLKEERKALLIMATATGKTVVGFETVDRYLEDVPLDGGAVIFLVNNKIILDEAEQSLKRKYGDKYKTSQIYEGVSDMSGEVIFATPSSLMNSGRLEELVSTRKIAAVVYDETHHVVAPFNKEVYLRIEQESLRKNWRTAHLGMTATEVRPDKVSVVKFFDKHIAFEYPIRLARAQGSLVPFMYSAGDLDLNSKNGEAILPGDPKYPGFVQNRYADQRFPHLLSLYETAAEKLLDKRSLILAPTVERAQALARHFRENGITAVSLTGEDRTLNPQRFAHSYYAWKNLRWPEGSPFFAKPIPQIVVAVDIFKEGIDVPAINMVLLWADTNSSIVFLQSIGRGLRLAPFKTHLQVIDAIGLFRKVEILSYLGGIFNGGARKPSEEDQTHPVQEDEWSVHGLSVMASTDEVTQRVINHFDNIIGHLVLRYGTYTEIPARELLETVDPWIAVKAGFLQEHAAATLEKERGVRELYEYCRGFAERLVSGQTTDAERDVFRERFRPAFYFSRDHYKTDMERGVTEIPALDTDEPTIVFSRLHEVLNYGRSEGAQVEMRHLAQVFPEFSEQYRTAVRNQGVNLAHLRSAGFRKSPVEMGWTLTETFFDRSGNANVTDEKLKDLLWGIANEISEDPSPASQTSIHLAEGLNTASRIFRRTGQRVLTREKHTLGGAKWIQDDLIRIYLLLPSLKDSGLSKEDFAKDPKEFANLVERLGLVKQEYGLRQFLSRVDELLNEIAMAAVQRREAEIQGLRDTLLIVLRDPANQNPALSDDWTSATFRRILSFAEKITAVQQELDDKNTELEQALDTLLDNAGLRWVTPVEGMDDLRLITVRADLEGDRFTVATESRSPEGRWSPSSTPLEIAVREDYLRTPHLILVDATPSGIETLFQSQGEDGRIVLTDALVDAIDPITLAVGREPVVVIPSDKSDAPFFASLFERFLQLTSTSVLGQLQNTDPKMTSEEAFAYTIRGLSRSRLPFLNPEMMSDLWALRRQWQDETSEASALARKLTYIYRTLFEFRTIISPRWAVVKRKLEKFESKGEVLVKARQQLLFQLQRQFDKDISGPRRLGAMRMVIDTLEWSRPGEPLTPEHIQLANLFLIASFELRVTNRHARSKIAALLNRFVDLLGEERGGKLSLAEDLKRDVNSFVAAALADYHKTTDFKSERSTQADTLLGRIERVGVALRQARGETARRDDLETPVAEALIAPQPVAGFEDRPPYFMLVENVDGEQEARMVLFLESASSKRKVKGKIISKHVVHWDKNCPDLKGKIPHILPSNHSRLGVGGGGFFLCANCRAAMNGATPGTPAYQVWSDHEKQFREGRFQNHIIDKNGKPVNNRSEAPASLVDHLITLFYGLFHRGQTEAAQAFSARPGVKAAGLAGALMEATVLIAFVINNDLGVLGRALLFGTFFLVDYLLGWVANHIRGEPRPGLGGHTAILSTYVFLPALSFALSVPFAVLLVLAGVIHLKLDATRVFKRTPLKHEEIAENIFPTRLGTNEDNSITFSSVRNVDFLKDTKNSILLQGSLQDGRRVVIKVLNPHSPHTGLSELMLDHEARVMEDLATNYAPLYERHFTQLLGRGRIVPGSSTNKFLIPIPPKGLPYLIFKEVPGRTLYDQHEYWSSVAREKGLQGIRRAEIGLLSDILEVGRSLQALNKVNIFHRDLGPTEMFINDKSPVRFVDLGLTETLFMSVSPKLHTFVKSFSDRPFAFEWVKENKIRDPVMFVVTALMVLNKPLLKASSRTMHHPDWERAIKFLNRTAVHFKDPNRIHQFSHRASWDSILNGLNFYVQRLIADSDPESSHETVGGTLVWMWEMLPASWGWSLKDYRTRAAWWGENIVAWAITMTLGFLLVGSDVVGNFSALNAFVWVDFVLLHVIDVTMNRYRPQGIRADWGNTGVAILIGGVNTAIGYLPMESLGLLILLTVGLSFAVHAGINRLFNTPQVWWIEKNIAATVRISKDGKSGRFAWDELLSFFKIEAGPLGLMVPTSHADPLTPIGAIKTIEIFRNRLIRMVESGEATQSEAIQLANSLAVGLSVVFSAEEYKGVVAPLQGLMESLNLSNPTDIIGVPATPQEALGVVKEALKDGRLRSGVRLVMLDDSQMGIQESLKQSLPEKIFSQILFLNRSDYRHVSDVLRQIDRQLFRLSATDTNPDRRFFVSSKVNLPLNFFNWTIPSSPSLNQVDMRVYIHLILETLQTMEIPASHLPNWEAIRAQLISA